ncbi:MAG: hypothetical protein HYR55_11985 [Acidobacteria bacterium]|nr:hypothetical protein [Acidobacteriota bacterium]MBI3657527.1 hypothetical protein [Acidobacteriota bacterium]
MSTKTITEFLEEADLIATRLEAFLTQTAEFNTAKPGGQMQAFYRAMRVIHDHLSNLSEEQRARFDVLNERFKNLTGDISRRLK